MLSVSDKSEAIYERTTHPYRIQMNNRIILHILWVCRKCPWSY